MTGDGKFCVSDGHFRKEVSSIGDKREGEAIVRIKLFRKQQAVHPSEHFPDAVSVA